MKQQPAFDEILAAAIDVLGSRDDAEKWLANPAFGLERHCPVDLIASPEGLQQVMDHLERLRYGVYT
jgi:putative toxin-antitoxin system antitoxin component (TIGR02293 family)